MIGPRPGHTSPTRVRTGVIDQMTMQTPTQPAPSRRLLSAREAGAYLNCAPSTIYAAVAAGALRPLRVSARLRFDRADLDAMIEASKATGRPVFGAPIDKSRRDR